MLSGPTDTRRLPANATRKPAMRCLLSNQQPALRLLVLYAIAASAMALASAQQAPLQGISSVTSVAGWPLNPDIRLIQRYRFHIASRAALPAQRLELEAALKKAFEVAVPPVVGAVRTTNYTFIPAITAGYEGYNSVVYEVDTYILKDIDAQSVALSPPVVFLTSQLLQKVLRDEFSSDVKFLVTERYYTSTPAQRAAQPVVNAFNTSQLYANTFSHVQLSGEGLLPFNADKQTAFAMAVYYAFGNRTNLYSINTTDLAVPPTAVRTRQLLQAAVPTVVLGVWTQSLAANYSASGYWDRVFSSAALQSIGPFKLNLTGQFLNATTQLRTYNETTLSTTHDPPLAETDASDVSLSGGAIAGIVIGSMVGAMLLIAAIGALIFRRRQHRRVRKIDAEAAAATATTDSCGNDSFDGKQPGKAEDLSFQSAAKLWGSDGSYSSSPAGVAGVAASAVPNAGQAPTLEAADIQICVDALGRAPLISCTHGAQVYRGRHRQRDVAVKELSTQNRSADAIHSEVQLAQRVSHDVNVVQFYGTAAAPTAVLLVMEFMPGGDLRAALDGQGATEYRWHARGAKIAACVARGLAYIHSIGVVHRDVKSSNVLLSADGTAAKLADFGSAMLVGAAEVAEDRPRGTLAWAAPELLAGAAVDSKADVYSLGVVLWEVATGEVPVRGVMRELRVPADCPHTVARLVAACSAVDPAQRPTAAQVAEQLQALAGGSTA